MTGAFDLGVIDMGDDVAHFDACSLGGALGRFFCGLGNCGNDDRGGVVDPNLTHGGALIELCFWNDVGAFEREWCFFSGAFDEELDLFAFAKHDVFVHAIEAAEEAVYLFAIDGNDFVTDEHAGFLCWAIRCDVADFGAIDEVLGLSNDPDEAGGKEGEAETEGGAGCSDDDFVDGLDGREFFAAFGIASFDCFHGGHLRERDVTSGRDTSQTVLHAVDGLFPNRLSEPNVELVDDQAPPFCGEEVTELVDEDEDVEEPNDDDDGSEEDQEIHGWVKIVVQGR